MYGKYLTQGLKSFKGSMNINVSYKSYTWD